MRAVTWHGTRDVRVESVPDPRIVEQPRMGRTHVRKQDSCITVVLTP